jgi:hypothetical protein
MMFAGPKDVSRVKGLALDAYVKWKIEQLVPIAKQWMIDGADLPEIQRRVEDLRGEFQDEAKRALRCVTIAALQDGADNG